MCPNIGLKIVLTRKHGKEAKVCRLLSNLNWKSSTSRASNREKMSLLILEYLLSTAQHIGELYYSAVEVKILEGSTYVLDLRSVLGVLHHFQKAAWRPTPFRWRFSVINLVKWVYLSDSTVTAYIRPTRLLVISVLFIEQLFDAEVSLDSALAKPTVHTSTVLHTISMLHFLIHSPLFVQVTSFSKGDVWFR